MPAAARSDPTVDRVDERLSSLQAMVTQGFEKLERLVEGVDARVRALETSALADLAVAKSKVEALTTRVQGIEETQKESPSPEELTEVVKAFPRLNLIASIAIGIIVLFTTLVAGLIWAILTHQVVIGGTP